MNKKSILANYPLANLHQDRDAALGLGLKAISTGATFFLSSNASVGAAVPKAELGSWPIYFLWFLFMLVLNSLSEELVYRVFPIQNFVSRNLRWAFIVVLFTATLFSAAHLATEEPNLLRFIYRMSFGTLAGLVFLHGSSLWAVVGLHTGWNFIALVVSDADWKTGTLLQAMNFDVGTERLANAIVLLTALTFYAFWMRTRHWKSVV